MTQTLESVKGQLLRQDDVTIWRTDPVAEILTGLRAFATTPECQQMANRRQVHDVIEALERSLREDTPQELAADLTAAVAAGATVTLHRDDLRDQYVADILDTNSVPYEWDKE